MTIEGVKVSRGCGAVEVAREQHCDTPAAKLSTERLLLNMTLLIKEMLGEIEELREGKKILEAKLAAADTRQKKLFDEEF
jgi:hypothetical protein